MKTYNKRGVITGSNKDETNRPIQKVKYFGRTTDVEIVFPYGVHANLPEESSVIVFPLLNQTGNMIAIGGMPNERIQIEQGEVVFYHPVTKAKIHFKNDGTIEIDALDKDITVNCKNASITATDTLTVDAPTTNWKGDINQDGKLTNTQTTSNGVKLDGHTHIGSPTAPVGSVSNTGVSL